MKATVTSKGQVTIPLPIRTEAKISPGAKLDFQIAKDGTLRVSLVNQGILELKGIVKSKRKKPVTLTEMKKVIRKAAKRAIQ